MNNRIIIIILISSGFVTFCRAGISSYLSDKRLVDSELQCLLQTGECSAFGEQMKLMLPVILKDNCGHCTIQQKRSLQRLIQFMQSRYPSEWRKIHAIYTSPTYVNDNK